MNHHGVGTVSELETGLVIDTHVMSNYCLSCAKETSVSVTTYLEWYKFHKLLCQKLTSLDPPVLWKLWWQNLNIASSHYQAEAFLRLCSSCLHN